jgi:adenylate kinase family enzyme
MFSEHYKGGAELTSEAIIDGSLFPVNKVLTSQLTTKILEDNKNHFWIFGNFANLSQDCMLYAAKNLQYSVIEYDYKYCKYRLPEKHAAAEGRCDCATSMHAKVVSIFLNNAVKTWWMSKKQMEIQQEVFPFLKNDNNAVLSSIFSEETLNYIDSLDATKKNDKWIILDSPSWVKGVEASKQYAEENNLEYEMVWGLEYKHFLKKMAESKGMIFLPNGSDTCPRMIIEAKLLGCELILNDNVQHKDEDWFQTKETVKEYLKNRSKFFWSNLENVAYDIIGTPPKTEQVNNNIKYKIIIPFYNVEKWIEKSIESLKRQDYENFDCILIDDMSTDKTCEVINNEISDDKRFTLIKNKEKKYALQNIYESIESQGCNDEDVIILLDGDDWFASGNTLSYLSKVYNDSNSLMTYGSYVYNPSGQKGVEPSEHPQEVLRNNTFREDRWRASHLRSFKYEIWKKINKKDLQDGNQDFYKMAYDQAIMLPLLEMASERATYVDKVLYVYNKDNPLNVDKIKQKRQYETSLEIRKKPKYNRL